MELMTNQKKETICIQAGNYFGNGYHCAEAVVLAVLEGSGQTGTEATACATAFGGGFGKTYGEACGALSGALITIGHFYGRRTPGENWDFSADLGKDIRQRFLNEFGTTQCAALRDRFGEECQMDECRKVVRQVTLSLIDLLTGKGLELQSEENDMATS